MINIILGILAYIGFVFNFLFTLAVVLIIMYIIYDLILNFIKYLWMIYNDLKQK